MAGHKTKLGKISDTILDLLRGAKTIHTVFLVLQVKSSCIQQASKTEIKCCKAR